MEFEKEMLLKSAREICEDFPGGCAGCEFYGVCKIEQMACERLTNSPRRLEKFFYILKHRLKAKRLTR